MKERLRILVLVYIRGPSHDRQRVRDMAPERCGEWRQSRGRGAIGSRGRMRLLGLVGALRMAPDAAATVLGCKMAITGQGQTWRRDDLISSELCPHHLHPLPHVSAEGTVRPRLLILRHPGAARVVAALPRHRSVPPNTSFRGKKEVHDDLNAAGCGGQADKSDSLQDKHCVSQCFPCSAGARARHWSN